MLGISILNLDKKKKNILLIIIDISIIVMSYYICSLFYYGMDENIKNELVAIIIAILVYVLSLKIFKMYNCIWINAGAYEFTESIMASISGFIITSVIIGILPIIKVPIIVNIISAILIMIGTTGIRLSLRIITRAVTYFSADRVAGKYNVLIIGAGYCAAAIIREIRKEESSKFNIIGIIDDDISKKNNYLNGVKILGTREDIEEIVDRENIDQILFAIVKIDSKEKAKILDICSNTKAKVKVIPGYHQILEDGTLINKMRDIDLKDLIGREEVELDKCGIESYIKDKVILVTGGGGSIGSELCRQIAKFNPKLLLILDIYENNAYDLQNELNYTDPQLRKKVIIASVRDKQRINQIISKYKPNIIFHAAAHKHVPLMEDNPTEAIKNNVLGTLNMAQLASEYKVDKFVLISTDKAVNPTNVMGASKRLCEMIVQAINNEKDNETEFVAVRFGNVLGSNGSVIPLFKKQIKNGGPITLTHKDITRYFMLIPEAAQLVLQAGAYAKGGEVFVLDMGSPVKIYDLAENLIKLSGYTPNKDIKIEITGLRPGEKLYEELLMNNDNLSKTAHEKIFIDRPESKSLNKLLLEIEELVSISKIGNKNMLIDKLKEIVPTYSSPEIYNNKKILEEVSVTAKDR